VARSQSPHENSSSLPPRRFENPLILDRGFTSQSQGKLTVPFLFSQRLRLARSEFFGMCHHSALILVKTVRLTDRTNTGYTAHDRPAPLTYFILRGSQHDQLRLAGALLQLLAHGHRSSASAQQWPSNSTTTPSLLAKPNSDAYVHSLSIHNESERVFYFCTRFDVTDQTTDNFTILSTMETESCAL